MQLFLNSLKTSTYIYLYSRGVGIVCLHKQCRNRELTNCLVGSIKLKCMYMLTPSIFFNNIDYFDQFNVTSYLLYVLDY